jgi:hypothetical protein
VWSPPDRRARVVVQIAAQLRLLKLGVVTLHTAMHGKGSRHNAIFN